MAKGYKEDKVGQRVLLPTLSIGAIKYQKKNITNLIDSIMAKRVEIQMIRECANGQLLTIFTKQKYWFLVYLKWNLQLVKILFAYVCILKIINYIYYKKWDEIHVR